MTNFEDVILRERQGRILNFQKIVVGKNSFTMRTSCLKMRGKHIESLF